MELHIAKSQFAQWLIERNHLDDLGFKRWLFQPGMLFKDTMKWWGDKSLRPSLHEGVDFCCFEDQAGNPVFLNKDTLVPVMYDGEVVQIFDDFTGQSIQVAHNIYNDSARLHSIYAHSLPDDNLRVGDTVKAGNCIGSISATARGRIVPHLHISVIWVSQGTPLQKIRWETINDPGLAGLCDPLDFMEIDSNKNSIHII